MNTQRELSKGFIDWAHKNLNFDFTLTHFPYQRGIANKVWNIINFAFYDQNDNIEINVVKNIISKLPKNRYNKLYCLYLDQDSFLA